MSDRAHPFSFGEARDEDAAKSEAQHEASQAYIRDTDAYAKAERAYRTALAVRILELRMSKPPVPVTIIGDLARGDAKIAELKYTRDLAAGRMEAAKQVAWQRNADRRAAEEFIKWSAKVSPSGEYPPIGDEGRRPVFGARAA